MIASENEESYTTLHQKLTVGLDGKCLLHLCITTIDLLKPFYKLSQIVENDFNTMSDGRTGDDHIEFESDATIVENLVSHCRAGFKSCQDKQKARLAKEHVTMEKERVAAAAAKDEAKKAIDKAEEKVKKKKCGRCCRRRRQDNIRA